MVKTTYKEIQDLMANIVSMNADAYHAYMKKQLSEETLTNIINTTNIAITKCEQVMRGNFE